MRANFEKGGATFAGSKAPQSRVDPRRGLPHENDGGCSSDILSFGA